MEKSSRFITSSLIDEGRMKAPMLMTEAPNFKAGDTIPAFSFRKRFERIDWRKLASVDVNRVSVETDFQVLQDNIAAITFCDIESEFDTSSVDPNFIKIFKLAQLTIEYLLHSQDYLTDVITNLNEKLQEAQNELQKEQEQRGKDKLIIQELKKENKRRRKMLENQQQQILSTSAVNGNFSQCLHCPKVFVNTHFLQTHLLRRHPEAASTNGAINSTNTPNHTHLSPSLQAKTIEFLEREVKELKEKLTHAENNLQDERKVISEYLNKEKNEIPHIDFEEKLKELENSKKEELEKHKEEIERIKGTLMKEIQELHEKHQSSEQALQKLQEQYAYQGQKSNLGELEDADLTKFNQELLEKQQDEFSGLQQNLKQQLSSMETQVHHQLLEQEKRWKGRMKQMTQDHAAELEKLKSMLEECVEQLNEERKNKGEHAQWYEQQVQELLQQTQKHEIGLKKQEKQISQLVSKPVPSPVSTPVKKVRPASPPRSNVVTEARKPVPAKRTRIIKVGNNETKKPTMNPLSRVKEVVKQRPLLLEGLKDELESLVEDKLEILGVNSSLSGMTSNALKKQLSALKTEQKKLANKYPEFSQIREELQKRVEEEAERKLKDVSLYSDSNASTETRKSILKNSTKPKFYDSQLELNTPSDEDQQEIAKSPKKITFVDAPPLSGRKIMTPAPTLESSSSSSSSSEDEVTDSDNEEEPAGVKDGARQIQVAPRYSKTTSRQVSFEETTNKNKKVIDHDKWDTDSDLDNDNNPQIDDGHFEPRVLKVRPPTGQKVTALAQSLEMQLSRRSEEAPVGAVDIMKGMNQSSKSQNQIKTNGMYPVNDSDDYSISSLEDLSEPLPKNKPSKGMNSLKNGFTTSTPVNPRSVQQKRSGSVGSAWDSSDEE